MTLPQLRIGPSGPNVPNFAYGPVIDNGLSSALIASTINWEKGLVQKVTLDANTALPIYAGWHSGLVGVGLLIVAAGAGGFTPTLPAVKTPGNAPLAWSLTAGALNLVDLMFDGGLLFASLRGTYPP